MALSQAEATPLVTGYLEALSKAEREGPVRFDQVFRNPPAGVGVHELDADMRITRVNPEELKILGYRAEEMVGRRAWELIVMEEASRRAIELKLAGEKELKPFVRSFRRSDGTAIALLLADQHLRSPQGKIVGLRTAMTEVRPEA
jgi:PAS domain S-box-containing protein